MVETGVAALDGCWRDLLDGTTPERIHKFRVALRQLRVVLHLFQDLEPAGRIADLRQALAGIALEAGRLRDLDVMIDEIVRPLQDVGDVGDVSPLVAVLEAERDRAREEAGRLTSQGAVALRRQLQDLPQHIGAWLDDADHKATIGKFAHRYLKRRWRKLERQAEVFNQLDAAGLHEMRKALKKLRYAFASFAPFWDTRAGAKFVRQMQLLQTMFGYFNDVQSAKLLMGRMTTVEDRCNLGFSIGVVLGTHIERASHVHRNMLAQWQKLAATHIGRELSKA